MSHMRNQIDSTTACTGLVQKYVGSAFETVQIVANHIDDLKPLFGLSPGDLQKIISMAPDINRLLQGMQAFADRYYGALDHEPLTRPSGDPSEHGDLYYDTLKGGLYVFEAAGWLPVTGVDNIVDNIIVSSAHFQGTNIVIPVKDGYDPTTNNLMVFVNGVYQYAITQQNPQGAYVETDNHTITFPGAVLQKGDLVTCIVGKIVTNIVRTIGVELGNYRTTLDGERVITLPSGMFYDPGIGNLEVYVDGRLQMPTIDYSETDKHTVTFNNGLPSGSLVVFKKGAIVASGSTTGTGNTSTIRILNLMGEIFHLPLDRNVPLICKGRTAIGDGGFGLFLYEPLQDKLEANGGTVIDPSVVLGAQGTGTGNGCWVRQYDGHIEAAWFGMDRFLMQDMVQVKTPRHGDILQLEGFHSVGDEGEGEFYWDESWVGSQHDGGTVIRPGQPFPPSWGNLGDMIAWYNTGSAIGLGAWKRLFKDEVSLSWFGAKGDDATDNSGILIGLKAAILNNRIDTLKVPVGTYLFNLPRQLEVSNYTKGIKIFGTGKNSILHFATGAHPNPIQFINATGIEIEHVYFKDERTTTNNTLLSFLNTNKVLVENCWFDHAPGTSIEVREDYINMDPPKACDDIRILNNHFDSCGQAVIVKPAAESTDQVISNNSFLNCGTQGPCVSGGQGCIGFRVQNNFFRNTQDSAIKTQAFHSSLITNNEIEDFIGNAIEIDASTVPAYPSLLSQQIRCFGNWISTFRPTYQEKFGVFIHGNFAAGFIEVSNNTLVNISGIKLDPETAQKNVVITENKIRNSPDSPAIVLDITNGGVSDGVYIADNYIENEDVTRINEMVHFHGVLNTLLKGNIFRRSGAVDIGLVNCDGTQIIGNLFIESNVGNVLNKAIIESSDSNVHTLIVSDNEIIKGKLGKAQGLVTTSNNNTQVRLSGNRMDDKNDILVRSPITNVVSEASSIAGQSGRNKIFFGSTIPVAGSYQQGDIMFSQGAAAAGQVGWVCITSGQPGTWKAFGTIQP